MLLLLFTDTTVAELIKGVTDKQTFLEMIYTEQRECVDNKHPPTVLCCVVLCCIGRVLGESQGFAEGRVYSWAWSDRLLVS